MSQRNSDRVPKPNIDWERARIVARTAIIRQLAGGEASEVDDLVQEALIKSLRALRRQTPREFDALLTTIAQRTAIDHLRKRVRWRLIVHPMTDEVGETFADRAPGPEHFGDPSGRIRFVVLEYFKQHHSGCHELAIQFFKENDWKRVASGLGKSHAAIRRQWSRCVGFLRAAVRRDPIIAELGEWAAGA